MTLNELIGSKGFKFLEKALENKENIKEAYNYLTSMELEDSIKPLTNCLVLKLLLLEPDPLVVIKSTLLQGFVLGVLIGAKEAEVKMLNQLVEK